MGIAAADPDTSTNFHIEHGITFTTLTDHPDLVVTSHYNIGHWSEFWLLDTHGNRIGNQPTLFATDTAQQLLDHHHPTNPKPDTWKLQYLAGGGPLPQQAPATRPRAHPQSRVDS